MGVFQGEGRRIPLFLVFTWCLADNFFWAGDRVEIGTPFQKALEKGFSEKYGTGGVEGR